MPTLDFKGKPLVYAHHLTVPSRTLEPDAKQSLLQKGSKPSLDDNLIIHGDNLHALKALMPRYAGKVNCTYIDPPYNTGNEGWTYNDNVNSPMMKEWLKDKSPVDGEDLERHDKWLCMMWPRLQLLKELLAEDGVTFVSIDDNEQHHLRMVMDEIFGEENFVATLPTIMNLKGNQDQFGFAGTHEYTFVYAKDITQAKIGQFLLNKDDMDDWEEDQEGFFKKGANLKATGVNAPRTKRPNLFFPIFFTKAGNCYVADDDRARNKDDRKILPITDGKETSWRWSKDKICNEKNNLIIEKINGTLSIYKKQRPALGDLPSKKPKTIFYKPEYSSGNGTAQMKELFDEKVFNNPKPIDLIRDFVILASPKNGIILDCMAGSGTTAHAVLALNKEDGGTRKFILVECENYANTVTAERVRRVIRGVPNAKDENLKEGLDGSFTYCTLGDEMSIETMLTGEKLPDYDTMARHVFWTATGRSADKINAKTKRGTDGLFYETDDRLFYLIYEPKLDFLRSSDSALNSDRAERITKQVKEKKKTAVVFATHKFMGQKELTQIGITFCGLPYETLSG